MKPLKNVLLSVLLNNAIRLAEGRTKAKFGKIQALESEKHRSHDVVILLLSDVESQMQAIEQSILFYAKHKHKLAIAQLEGNKYAFGVSSEIDAFLKSYAEKPKEEAKPEEGTPKKARKSRAKKAKEADESDESDESEDDETEDENED